MRYPVMPKERSREVRCEIRKVFVEIWDPIRVMDDPAWPRDEYDAYIGETFELLTGGGTDHDIVEYLMSALEGMGMDGSAVSLQTIVNALRKIDLDDKSRLR